MLVYHTYSNILYLYYDVVIPAISTTISLTARLAHEARATQPAKHDRNLARMNIGQVYFEKGDVYSTLKRVVWYFKEGGVVL